LSPISGGMTLFPRSFSSMVFSYFPRIMMEDQ
jgi:hypothetical protein